MRHLPEPFALLHRRPPVLHVLAGLAQDGGQRGGERRDSPGAPGARAARAGALHHDHAVLHRAQAGACRQSRRRAPRRGSPARAFWPAPAPGGSGTGGRPVRRGRCAGEMLRRGLRWRAGAAAGAELRSRAAAAAVRRAGQVAGDAVSVLAITGASGFVGRALLASLPAGRYAELRLLVHRAPPARSPEGTRVTTVAGDLLDPASVRALLVPGCTVIHLAQLAKPHPVDDNVAAARILLTACRDAGVARLVHCSTAVVAGDVPDDVITEDTPCRPATDYERAKYRIEQELREGAAGSHEIAILRPTVVFGPGGRNLMSQARRIARQSTVTNLAYSALQGRRRMNLVSVRSEERRVG